MKKIIILCLIAAFVIPFTACDDDNINPALGKVEIFLIKKEVEQNSYNSIDPKSIVLEETPFVSYNDLETYNQTTHTFQISKKAKETIYNLPNGGHQIAFALKANDEIIYTGHFWSVLSSAAYFGYHFMPGLDFHKDQLKIRLGLHGSSSELIDKRNHEKILRIFEADNKLRK